jgi:2-methylcitrate dehydratase PrpD
MTSIRDFAKALVDVAREPLADDARHETRRTLLNVLGTSIGASAVPEMDHLVGTLASYAPGEIAPPGRVERLDRYGAALAIGFAGHYDDFDDTHLATIIHPGAATLGALYPLALEEPVSPERALGAFAMGVESQFRVGLAMSPSHYDLGWHITGTCGVIGAAVAASLARSDDVDRLSRSISVALNFFVGHREAFGTPVKPFHAGRAGANGLLAADLAMSPLEIDEDGLEREGGFLRVLADEWNLEWLTPAHIAGRRALLDNSYKPYPCGIVAHPAIEAAVGLHGEIGAAALERARSVVVRCNPLVPELMGRKEATTGLEARFCAIHGVAVGLLCGKAGLAEFSDDAARRAEVVALRARSKLEADPECSRDAATVVVEFADGTQKTHHIARAAGSSGRPLSDDALLEKFTALVEPVMPGRSARLAELAMGYGESFGFADIAAALS